MNLTRTIIILVLLWNFAWYISSEYPDDFKSHFYLRWLISTRADPGFFLGGGASVWNGVTDFFCRIPVVLESRRSSGGESAHPLYPPPRSAPAVLLPHIGWWLKRGIKQMAKHCWTWYDHLFQEPRFPLRLQVTVVTVFPVKTPLSFALGCYN